MINISVGLKSVFANGLRTHIISPFPTSQHITFMFVTSYFPMKMKKTSVVIYFMLLCGERFVVERRRCECVNAGDL